MKNLILLTALLFAAITAHAQSIEFLKIQDVRNTWNTQLGSIDNATFFVEPKGLYAECQLLMTFSTSCTSGFSASDSLEIQLGFNLPAEAEVTDMWLWVNNVPVRAGIYDRWSASQVYNAIVKKRVDPALLLKESDTFYTLNIFPLMVNLPRKIKLTFLIPINKLLGTAPVIPLPANILNLSSCPVSNVKVAFKSGQNLSNPILAGMSSQVFSTQTDSVFGPCLAATISNFNSLSTLNLSLTQSAPGNYFAGIYPVPGSTQGIYQLQLDLPQILGIPQKKKTLFVMDFIKANSTLSRTTVLQTLKSKIQSNFGAGDSVNFMFSGLFTNTISPAWISADPVTLASVFSTMDSTLLGNYSNLPVLLFDAIDFIRTHGNDGNIMVLESSATYQNTSDANTLLTDIANYMGTPVIPIHSISLDNTSSPNYIINVYFKGNDYFFTNLSNFTGAEFRSIKTYSVSNNNWWWGYTTETVSFSALMDYFMPRLAGYFAALDVHTTFTNGFSFANYNFNASNGFDYLSSPYSVIGKYSAGVLPMTVDISAQTTDGQLYFSQISIDNPDVLTLDTVSKTIWAAHNLREMLGFNQTSAVVYQIIQKSIIERVLTKYTAFLALEPGIAGPNTIWTPPTGTGTVTTLGVQNETKNDVAEKLFSGFSIYPNPAVSHVNFEFNLTKSATVRIEIFNLQGQLVDVITEENLISGNQKLSLPTDKFYSGIYFYRIFFNEEAVKAGKFAVMK